MKKRIFTGLLAVIMGPMLLTACGGSGVPAANASPSAAESAGAAPAESASAETATMQYVTKEDLKEDIDAGGSGYIVIDVRVKADYDTQHIKGAFSGDVDLSVNGDDDETSTANLKAALNEATGSETGDAESKYVLVCYSGKKYAEAATGLMKEIGVPAENIFTLEGGNNGWAEAGDDYTSLME